MNIYWITKISNKRFYKTSRTEVAKALREKGHNVTLIIEKNIGEKNSDANTIALPTMPCRIISRLLFGIILFFYFPLIIKNKKVDVILVDAANIWMPFLLTTRFFKTSIVVDVRTLPTDKRLSSETIYYDISFYFSKFIAEGLTTITPELKEHLIQKYHFSENKIGVWTSGASKDFLNYNKPSDPNILFQKENDALYMMYHGSYAPTRGIETIIEAISEIEQPIKEKIHFLIVGMDPVKKKVLEKLSKQLNISDHISIFPPVTYDQIPNYIDLCDIGIIPLPVNHIWWHVSAPMKSLEYLSRGKPIIATDIPFHKRIFEKGDCGILIKIASKKDIKKAITDAYVNREKLHELGKNGKTIVKQYFTWDHSADRLVDFLKKNIL